MAAAFFLCHPCSPGASFPAQRPFHALTFPLAQESSRCHLILGSSEAEKGQAAEMESWKLGSVLWLQVATTVPGTGLPSASVTPTMHLASEESSCHTHLQAIIMTNSEPRHVPGPALRAVLP